MFKLTSLNLNGIRSATTKGAEAWIEATAPDCICVQEIKAQMPDLAGRFEALAGLNVTVETFGDVLSRGRELPDAPAPVSEEADPLALLIYTSGSTGAPKGAMYPESNMTSFWRRASTATM